jgi:vitamin B12 transporter
VKGRDVRSNDIIFLSPRYGGIFPEAVTQKLFKMKKIFFVLAAVTTSTQLFAQKDSSGILLDEAIVTANKFEQKQSQTGKTVSVITKEVLNKSSGKTLAQLLNEQAGIIVNGSLNSPGTVQTIFMRGASAGRVIVLVDGVPVYDPSMINNEFDLNFISIHDIERIEIARGAQSTVYGSDAIGGAINIITIKKDITKPVNGKITGIVGNRNTFKTHTTVYGKIKKISYQAKFNFIRSDGFSAAYDSTGNKNFDNDGIQGDFLSGRIQYDFTSAFSAHAYFQRSRYDADIDERLFTDEKDYILSHNNRIEGGGLEYKKAGYQVKLNYRHGVVRRQFSNDSGFVNPFGTKFERNHYNGFSHFLELYSNIKATEWLNILVGADYRHAKMNQSYFAITAFGPYDASFDNKTLNQFSGFGSAIISTLKKKLNIEIGGRINEHSKYGSNATYTINPSYSMTKQLRAFISVATGYKTPSIYQLFDAFAGNADLKPEKSNNYEGGLQYLNDKLNVRGLYFYRIIKNGLDFNYINFKYFNFVNQVVDGVEFEVMAKPTPWLNITGNYTLIKAEEKTQSRKTFIDTFYSYLLRRPKHSVNLNVGVNITKKFFTSVSAKYVSDRYDTGGFAAADVLMENYFLFNAYAEYKWTRVKLFADLQNITNKKFFDVRGYNSIPFTISGGITVEF